MEQVSTNKSHGGTQGVYTHHHRHRTAMTFSVFVPDHAPGTRLPVLWFLSGLTCTHANVTEKGEFRAACAEHGMIFIAPDTSPRGEMSLMMKPMISVKARASMSMQRRRHGIAIPHAQLH
jgi:S-formylglutathione hydrolase